MKKSDTPEMFHGDAAATTRLGRFLEMAGDALPDGCEKVFYTSWLAELESAPLDGFDRVYFGAEFCYKKLPSPRRLGYAMETAAGAGIPLTLVTPITTQTGLETVTSLLEHFEGAATGAEVVVNDWGIYHFIRRRLTGLVPVAGRVLIRQKKDPRIESLAEGDPDSYFSKSILDDPLFLEFLKKEDIQRAELDNLPQGIDVPDQDNVPALSIYYPYVFLTTSRHCAPGPCEYCGETAYILNHAMIGREILFKGKSQFYCNNDLGALKNVLFSRLIYQYTPPL